MVTPKLSSILSMYICLDEIEIEREKAISSSLESIEINRWIGRQADRQLDDANNVTCFKFNSLTYLMFSIFSALKMADN